MSAASGSCRPGVCHPVMAGSPCITYTRTTLMTSIIVEGVETREFRDDLDPRLVMLGIVGMMNWSHRWYNPAGRHSLHTIAKQFEEMVLDGLIRRTVRRR